MENTSTLNPPMEPPGLSALELIEQKSAASFFQPVVSIKKMGVVGLEALGRVVDVENQKLIEPEDMYKQVEEKKPRLALDRLFREKGLEGFAQVHAKIPGLLLFLNIDSSILTQDVVGSGHILNMVEGLRLDPNLIVLEIVHSKDMDFASVQKFVEIQRERNFLIALEDVNNTREMLDQVLHLNPDVLKLDKALTQGIAKDTFKREGFRTVVSLAKKMGILVVSDGIENEEDALVSLELGADMLQGSYLSKPQKGDSSTLGLKARIVFLASRYKRMMTERMNRDKDRKNRCEEIAKSIFGRLSGESAVNFEKKFQEFCLLHPQLECLYLLNEDGVQISETVCNLLKMPARKRFLFQPAPKGTDHSLKEYYYGLAYNNLSRYATEPYISLASGNLCITLSGVLLDPESGKSQILCADIDVSQV